MAKKRMKRKHKILFAIYISLLVLTILSSIFYVKFVLAAGALTTILTSPSNNSYSNSLLQTLISNSSSSTSTLSTSKLYIWNSAGQLVNAPPAGNMWTANYAGNSVTKVTPSGAMTTYSLPAGSGPSDIAFDGTNMWTANALADSVSKITPSGSVTTYYGTGSNPMAIAFDGTNMWTADDSISGPSLTKIYPNGTMINYTGSLGGPNGILFDGTNIWVSSYYSYGIEEFSTLGVSQDYHANLYGTGNYPQPRGFVFDGTNLWVSLYNNQNAAKVSRTGSVTTYSGMGATYTGGMTYDGTSVWVATSTTGVTKINPDGSKTSYTLSGGTAFNNVGYDGTNIWVTDNNVGGHIWKLNTSGHVLNTYSLSGAKPYAIAFDGATNLPSSVLFAYIKKISGTTDSANWTYSLPSSGTYHWNVYTCDVSGNCEFSASNYTITIDQINPSVTLNYPVSGGYSSQNVSFSAFASDNLGIENVSLYINGALDDSNSSGFNGTNYTFNATNLPTNDYTWYVTTCDVAGNCVNSPSRVFSVDVTPPAINIINPQPIYYGSNSSIPLNYSVYDAGSGVDSSWYNINYLNGTSVIGNTSLSGNTTFSVPSSGDYSLNFWSNDTLGNLNYSEVNFSVSLIGAVIVLNSPLNGHGFKSGYNATFNFTATDNFSINSCDLYINSTGTWALNRSLETFSGIPVISNVNLINNSFYSWNVNCVDSAGYSTWALNNVSFVTDNVTPLISNLSIFTTDGSKILYFTSNESDLNLDSCFYIVYNSTGGIDGSNNNVTFTCNSQASVSVSGYGYYNITVYVEDLGGNLNFTRGNFTTTAPVSSPSTGGSGGGSGGGGTTVSDGLSTLGNSTDTAAQKIIASVNLVNASAGVPSSINVSASSLGITSFTVTTKENIRNATITLLETGSKVYSSSLNISSSGKTYQAFEVNLSGINDSQISNVIINFRVNKSWVENNNVNVSDIGIYRNPGNGTWTGLPTTFIGNDSQFYYFSALSSGFSIYAIFAKGGTPVMMVAKSAGNFFNAITPSVFKKTVLGYIIYYFLLALVISGIFIVSHSIYKKSISTKSKKIWKQANKKGK